MSDELLNWFKFTASLYSDHFFIKMNPIDRKIYIFQHGNLSWWPPDLITIALEWIDRLNKIYK